MKNSTSFFYIILISAILININCKPDIQDRTYTQSPLPLPPTPPPPPPPPPLPTGTTNLLFWININPHDTVLNLPVNTITLKASAWSMTNQPFQPAIASIEWKKVSGPDNYLINSPNALSTTINSMVDGLYAFQCKITDSLGNIAAFNAAINVTDTTNYEKEVIVPDQTWYGTLGECIYIQFNLSQYVPANKSIKKIFIKEDCDTAFTRVYYLSDAPANYPFVYQFESSGNGFSLIVYECGTFTSCISDPNNKPDIKIVY